jgi:aspartate aminotransferase-like enzyme
MAKAYGLDVRRIDVPLGRAVDPDLVRDELRKEGPGGARAVLLTHNETSVGVLNPLKEIAPIVRESGKLFLVDSVSGAGAVELDIDGWGIDVCVTASQKAWGAPPGLAMVTVGERAWKATERAMLPRYYFDFQKAKASLEKGATPWTPAVTVVIALQEALRLMSEEGLEAIIQRHVDLARATRRGVQALGLGLFSDETYASPTVTAVRSPARVDSRNLARVLRDEYDVVVAGGQGKLEGQIFRLGHMGFVTISDITSMLGALELALRRFNISAEPGTAITAALRAYAAEPVPAGARRG